MWHMIIESGTLVAELAIAVVIYYEIEENRASAFLQESYGDTYKKRSEIYNKFVDAVGETLEEKTKRFMELLRSDHALLDDCNMELLQFARYHHMLRRSFFHRNLMSEWFPQVLVKLWVILGQYTEQMQPNPSGWREGLMRAVLRSL